MQTIARANPVYGNKQCGLIIDYLDVFKYLKRALADYAASDSDDEPVKDIAKLLSQLNESIENDLQILLRSRCGSKSSCG